MPRGVPRDGEAKRAAQAQTVLDLIPRLGRAVQADRNELQQLLPHLDGGFAQAAKESLAASDTNLRALHRLGEVVKDQRILLDVARRRQALAQAGQASRTQAQAGSGPQPRARTGGQPAPGAAQASRPASPGS